MKPTAYFSVGLIVLVLAGVNFQGRHGHEPAPSFGEMAAESGMGASDTVAALAARFKPALPVPPRVALQAGHWRAAEAPDELSGLRSNGGTSGGGKQEWEVNLQIAELTATLLDEAGYEVEILPATVPPRYEADVFVAIHADGNRDPSIAGYRVAAPRRDATDRAGEFAEMLAQAYGEATGIHRLPVATRRMRGYYAFRYNRYRHAIHPMTVGVIIETGFLTSTVDRRVIVDDPAQAARGIFAGVTRFLGPASMETTATPPASTSD